VITIDKATIELLKGCSSDLKQFDGLEISKLPLKRPFINLHCLRPWTSYQRILRMLFSWR